MTGLFDTVFLEGTFMGWDVDIVGVTGSAPTVLGDVVWPSSLCKTGRSFVVVLWLGLDACDDCCVGDVDGLSGRG
jgi:hypothetical protein